MEIRGKERKFLLTVGGRDEIAALCPNGDITEISTVLSESKSTELLRKISIIMNRDYEDHTKYYNPSYETDYLTDDDLKMLTLEEFRVLNDEMSDAFLKGMGITVETDDKKGKKTAKRGEDSTKSNP